MMNVVTNRPHHLFLLSPAYCGGRRADILLRPESTLAIAERLRAGALSIADAFSFMSGLYFRGKIAYARAFGESAVETHLSALVITPTRGLLHPDDIVTPELLHEFAAMNVDEHEARYRRPLERDAARIAAWLPDDAKIVLLGSVATGKYAEVLTAMFGTRLHYPAAFIGRGDMSRGGLMLRSVASGDELEYVVLDPAAPRRGARPPKLTPLHRTRASVA